ncbi:MAG: FAD-dependent oxidoreductase [Candidatus Wallbacteria bacterium]|nr:FAD-dependent oxidoreductase [Candidatus Wallbacteria bacterium]
MSAWAGLYFFAGDFGGTCVLPGGNARIVREMVDRLEAKTPGRLMTGKMVARIRPAAGGWRVTTVDRRGKAAVLASKTIVVASPKHVVAKMVEGLADDQLRAMSAIHRRAYLVANVLLKRPILRDLYGGYTLGGDDYGDLGVAEWPSRKPTKRSVLTLYRPFCDDISRPQLLVDGFFGAFQSHARDYMLRTFGRQGLKGEDIADVRLARWGHSMIYPSPGQLSDGVYEVAGRPLKGLWFACQDSFGAPCLEAALGAAFQSAAAAKKHLG